MHQLVHQGHIKFLGTQNIVDETINFREDGSSIDKHEERSSRRSLSDRAAGPQTVEQAFNAASEWETANRSTYRRFSSQQVHQEQVFSTMESKSDVKDESKKDSGVSNYKKHKKKDDAKAEDKQSNKKYMPLMSLKQLKRPPKLYIKPSWKRPGPRVAL